MNDTYRPRFAFDVTEEQQARANRLFPTHGQRKDLMSVVLDELMDLLEEHGQIIAGLIMDKIVKPREVIPILAKAVKRAKGE